MHTHLIKKCEEDQIRVVEVVLFHITIALMRGGYSLVTLYIHCEGRLAPRYLILLYCIIIFLLHDSRVCMQINLSC